MTNPQEFNGGVPGGNYDAEQAPNGTWTIKALPIFSEVEPGKRGNQKHIGPEWMNAAIAKSTELKEVQQHMAPVHLGHHGALKNKETPRVGFLKPSHIGRLPIEGKSQWVLFADVVGISRNNMKDLRNLSHPYRSVEIGDWNKPEIASLALLSDESPYFKFPMLTIGQMKAHAGKKPIQFGAEWDGNHHFFEFATPQGISGKPGQWPQNPEGLKKPGSKKYKGGKQTGWVPSLHSGGLEKLRKIVGAKSKGSGSPLGTARNRVTTGMSHHGEWTTIGKRHGNQSVRDIHKSISLTGQVSKAAHDPEHQDHIPSEHKDNALNSLRNSIRSHSHVERAYKAGRLPRAHVGSKGELGWLYGYKPPKTPPPPGSFAGPPQPPKSETPTGISSSSSGGKKKSKPIPDHYPAKSRDIEKKQDALNKKRESEAKSWLKSIGAHDSWMKEAGKIWPSKKSTAKKPVDEMTGKEWFDKRRTPHYSAPKLHEFCPVWFRKFSDMPVWMGEFQTQPTDFAIQNNARMGYIKALARANKTSNTQPAGRIDGQGFREFAAKEENLHGKPAGTKTHIPDYDPGDRIPGDIIIKQDHFRPTHKTRVTRHPKTGHQVIHVRGRRTLTGDPMRDFILGGGMKKKGPGHYQTRQGDDTRPFREFDDGQGDGPQWTTYRKGPYRTQPVQHPLHEFAEKGGHEKYRRRRYLERKFGRKPKRGKLTDNPATKYEEREFGWKKRKPEQRLTIGIGGTGGRITRKAGGIHVHSPAHPSYKDHEEHNIKVGQEPWNPYDLGSTHTSHPEDAKRGERVLPGKGGLQRSRRLEDVGFVSGYRPSKKQGGVTESMIGPKSRAKLWSSTKRLNKRNEKAKKEGRPLTPWHPPRAPKAGPINRRDTIPSSRDDLMPPEKIAGEEWKEGHPEYNVPYFLPESHKEWHKGMKPGERSYRNSEFSDMEFADSTLNILEKKYKAIRTKYHATRKQRRNTPVGPGHKETKAALTHKMNALAKKGHKALKTLWYAKEIQAKAGHHHSQFAEKETKYQHFYRTRGRHKDRMALHPGDRRANIHPTNMANKDKSKFPGRRKETRSWGTDTKLGPHPRVSMQYNEFGIGGAIAAVLGGRKNPSTGSRDWGRHNWRHGLGAKRVLKSGESPKNHPLFKPVTQGQGKKRWGAIKRSHAGSHIKQQYEQRTTLPGQSHRGSKWATHPLHGGVAGVIGGLGHHVKKALTGEGQTDSALKRAGKVIKRNEFEKAAEKKKNKDRLDRINDMRRQSGKPPLMHEFGSFALQRGQAKRLMGTRKNMGVLKLNKNGQMSNKLNMAPKNSALRKRENRGIARPAVRFREKTKAKWLIQPPGLGWY